MCREALFDFQNIKRLGVIVVTSVALQLQDNDKVQQHTGIHEHGHVSCTLVDSDAGSYTICIVLLSL